eukprot:TRINITY_DN4829_c0_g4_i2.p1 TRINITY_DN4829_c0_g4~~TRINITY_DN4829_c0_g4_i2.p1  ORF type:complete len:317 (-),score=46.60 TRINITY_DN4829_c0_g4_i2:90-1040(-)
MLMLLIMLVPLRIMLIPLMLLMLLFQLKMEDTPRTNGKWKRSIGDYIIGAQVVGVGSTTVVHLATHVPTGERVCCKVIDISSKENRHRARKEVRLLKKHSKCPNIIKYYTHYECDNYLYIFLEHARGGDLYKYIRRYGRLDEDKARLYMYQILEAMNYLHQNNVSHHDIKLENILLSGDTIRISDFGLAVEFQSGSSITTYSGSPLYMSPEIFSLQPHSENTDVWSLGVCLFYMLYDTFPFLASTYSDLEERVIFNPLIIPRNMGVSRDAKDLLRRMLKKDMLQRISVNKLLSHSWFAGINKKLSARRGNTQSPSC